MPPQFGAVQRASLGFQPATDPVARTFKVSEGVLIQTADPKGPAAAAGLLPTRRGLGGIVAGALRGWGLQGAWSACVPPLAAALAAMLATSPPHLTPVHLSWLPSQLAGDVIVAIDGRPVRNLFDLTSLLDERSPGDAVEVAALRGVDQGGAPERVTLRATLEAEAP